MTDLLSRGWHRIARWCGNERHRQDGRQLEDRVLTDTRTAGDIHVVHQKNGWGIDRASVREVTAPPGRALSPVRAISGSSKIVVPPSLKVARVGVRNRARSAHISERYDIATRMSRPPDDPDGPSTARHGLASAPGGACVPPAPKWRATRGDRADQVRARRRSLPRTTNLADRSRGAT